MSNPEQIDAEANKEAEIHDGIANEVRAAVKKATDSGRKSLIDSIGLGVALLNARNKLGGAFYKVIDNRIIHRKKINRYIKMVADTSCDDILANAPNNDDKGKLKLDKKVTALTEDDLPSLGRIPSMAKLTTMRHLSVKEFNKTLSGDNEAYNKLVEELNADSEVGKIKAKVKERLEKRYESKYDDDEFGKEQLKDEVDATMLQNKTFILRDLCDALDDNDRMFADYNELENHIIELTEKLRKAEEKIARLEAERKVRDQTLVEAGVIEKTA